VKVKVPSNKPKAVLVTHWFMPGGLIGCSASGQVKTSTHPVKVTCKRCLKTIADMRPAVPGGCA
jgi:hypothetical protein